MPILYWFPEPRVAPAKVWAKGSSSSEMNVSWEPVQQDMNGILLGYEVSTNWGCMGGNICQSFLLGSLIPQQEDHFPRQPTTSSFTPYTGHVSWTGPSVEYPRDPAFWVC